MAARGAIAKQEITQKLFEMFPYAFEYGNKEIRIPWKEDGNEVEIKITMTCAKTNVRETLDNDAAGATESSGSGLSEPTQEEMSQVAALMDRLGL